MSDLFKYLYQQEVSRCRYAEYNASSIALENARMEERIAELLSQHQPAASIGIDRDKMRQVLSYVQTGRVSDENV